MPPQWMWHLDVDLNQWFDRVREERAEKYGGGDSDGDTRVPLMQNELAEGRR